MKSSLKIHVLSYSKPLLAFRDVILKTKVNNQATNLSSTLSRVSISTNLPEKTNNDGANAKNQGLIRYDMNNKNKGFRVCWSPRLPLGSSHV